MSKLIHHVSELLIILCAIKCVFFLVKNVVFNYILTRKVNDKASEEELKVLNIIKKSDELRKTNEAVDAVPILATHKLSIDQVSPSLHQNGEVKFFVK